jgi:hypothetical protein
LIVGVSAGGHKEKRQALLAFRGSKNPKIERKFTRP